MRLLDRPREAALGALSLSSVLTLLLPLQHSARWGVAVGRVPSYLDRRNEWKQIYRWALQALCMFSLFQFFLFSLLSLSLSLDIEDDKGTLRPRMESKEVTGGLTTLGPRPGIHKHTHANIAMAPQNSQYTE